MPLKVLSTILPEDIAQELLFSSDSITEIRIRAGHPVQLICTDSARFVGACLTAQDLRRLALRMMDHSYYACEQELNQGYFTMAGGCRVGIGGSYIQTDRHSRVLQSIGSLCVRIARSIPDCATPIVAAMASGDRLHSTLLLSQPGLGKTTMLRDAARLLSGRGYIVGIADERSEIAACRDGVPSMDIGVSTDVVDGCSKALAIEHLIRSMAPQIIITDEIGNLHDMEAIREASRKGIRLIASAHAGSFEEFEAGKLGSLVREGLFSLAVLLKGKPGCISSFRFYDQGAIK